MRISDWSSDVCSSDLSCSRRRANSGTKAALKAPSAKRRRNRLGSRKAAKKASATGLAQTALAIRMSRTKPRMRLMPVRSEEHTSELQSLMRNSYAGLCLIKKNKNHKKQSHEP